MSRIKLSNNIFLSPGDAILRKDLHKYLGGSGQGGINPSSKSSSILIFTDPTEGAKHGYNDGWNKGIFEYFGSGLKGNMELKRVNKKMHTGVIISLIIIYIHNFQSYLSHFPYNFLP